MTPLTRRWCNRALCPLPSRWYEAHKEEIKRWRESKPHTMEEVMEIVRRELTVVPPLFAPGRYTTIVEGRPVQAQRYNLILFFGVDPLGIVAAFSGKSRNMSRQSSKLQRPRASISGPEVSLTRPAALLQAGMWGAKGVWRE